MKRILSFLKFNKGIALFIITCFIIIEFSCFPEDGDYFYRNGFFQLVRFLFDHSIALLPFPFFYVLAICAPVIVFFYFKSFEKVKGRIVLFFAGILTWTFSFFMWLWGFNYCCNAPVDNESVPKATAIELFNAGQTLTLQLNEEVKILAEMSVADVDEDLIRNSIATNINRFEISTSGRPAYYEVGLNGFLRKLGIAGIYNPFTGQCHGDESYLPYTRLYIAAHELSHGYGIASEAEADFFAYVALHDLAKSSTKFRVAADFELLRSIRYQLRILNDSLRLELEAGFSSELTAEFLRLKKNAEQFEEYFPGAQQKINDRYLKLMGVEDGVKNYDRFIDLVLYCNAHLKK